MQTTTLLLAHPQRLFRESLCALLEEQLGCPVLQTDTTAGVLEALPSADPCVLLMDVALPGINSVEIIKHLSAYHPTVRVLALAAVDLPASTLQLLVEAGIRGHLSLQAGRADLVHGVRQVGEGRYFFSPPMDRACRGQAVPLQRSLPARVAALTERELRIVTLLQQGYTSGAMAELLQVSRNTIEVHRYNIFRKLKQKKISAVMNYLSTPVLKTA